MILQIALQLICSDMSFLKWFKITIKSVLLLYLRASDGMTFALSSVRLERHNIVSDISSNKKHTKACLANIFVYTNKNAHFELPIKVTMSWLMRAWPETKKSPSCKMVRMSLTRFCLSPVDISTGEKQNLVSAIFWQNEFIVCPGLVIRPAFVQKVSARSGP